MNTLSLSWSFISLLKEKKPVMSLKQIIWISSIIAGQIWFIILFLEPSGTDQYEASYRNLRLSGYVLCIILPFLLIHMIESWLFNKRDSIRRAYHGLLFKILLVLLILSSGYLYKGLIVNESAVTLPDFVDFVLLIGLPYIPLVLPAAVLANHLVNRIKSRDMPEAREIVLRGRNQDEYLRLEEPEFIYAEAAQNYVTIHFMENSSPQKVTFRSTLKEIQKQVPVAEQVHRSYLVDPGHVKCIEGNSRKRFAKLIHLNRSIPVSSSYSLK